MARPLEPRKSKVAVPLPDDATLTPDIRQRLQQLPALNNLRMFANVPHCFLSITSLIDQLFHAGTIDPKLPTRRCAKSNGICVIVELRVRTSYTYRQINALVLSSDGSMAKRRCDRMGRQPIAVDGN